MHQMTLNAAAASHRAMFIEAVLDFFGHLLVT